ncbi:ABC transporter substrate-binding protein [Ramlibacter albus]|uniref:ABC transporter substrate-binding protein n=1 Tax=Ramlibacter albus TaxID=2079448 RepID=A0A923MAN0_9BURK|nr:ABC transporter substrate-binding protein [Ramlibacter albus]MBC5766480.1 ABC transporter substrate-binding protein [Ramlibacter albus]
MKKLAALAIALLATAASAQHLRVGLAEDPDALDPSLARTFVGRIVFSALCDKLVDIDEKLNIVPQLATSWQWSPDNKQLTMKLRPGVTFHDGEKFDAAAVKYNIERHKTIAGSNRRGELLPVTTVDVVDPMTVRMNLSAPFSPLLTVLADRAGMMVSPKAAQANPTNFGARPVCSGPFKFAERVAQDRIVLEKFADYWDKGRIHFDKITYLPIIDATVRLANLRSGQLDLIERMAPSDVASVKKDAKLGMSKITELGYQGITINTAKSDKAKQNPLGRDARVREAFELSLDREGIVKVAMDGEADVGNQWVPPTNSFYAKNVPIPKRNVARAKQLLKEAGVPNPSFTLMTPTTSDAQRIAQVVQAMAKEAGFDVKIQSTEFATSLNLADKGDYEAYVLAWSGRADPDGNLFSFYGCKQPLNYHGECRANWDDLLTRSRTNLDTNERIKVFATMAAEVEKVRPIVYLFHRHWLYAFNKKVTGMRPVPDGLVRVQGLKFASGG